MCRLPLNDNIELYFIIYSSHDLVFDKVRKFLLSPHAVDP